MSGVAVIEAHYLVGGTWTPFAAAHLQWPQVEIGLQAPSSNPLSFGSQANATCNLTVYDLALSDIAADLPIRVRMGIDATVIQTFIGTVSEATQTLNDATWQLKCDGIRETLNKTRLQSPLIQRRLVATRTTVASVDDPSAGNYSGGLLNYAFWQAGGRPYQQAASYPGALFYYDLDHALFAIDYAWFAGEPLWDECVKLVNATGGQLYQDLAGTVCFRQPLSIGDGTPTHTFFDTGMSGAGTTAFNNFSRTKSSQRVVTSVACEYTPRYVDVIQEVISDDTRVLIPAGKTVTLPLTPQYPLASLTQTAPGFVDPAAFTVVAFTGWPVPLTNYNHTVTAYAQQVSVTLINSATYPMQVEKIVLHGQPVKPSEQQRVVVGDPTSAQTLEQSPYVQSRAHAQRLCEMYLDFYGDSRWVMTFDAPFDPARKIGDAVSVAVASYSVTFAGVILGMSINTHTTTYTVLDAIGLPKLSEYFTVSASAQTADKRIGY